MPLTHLLAEIERLQQEREALWAKERVIEARLEELAEEVRTVRSRMNTSPTT